MRNRRWINVVEILLCIVLLIVIAGIFSIDRRETEERTEQVVNLKAEAKPYEDEIADIRQEISHRKVEMQQDQALPGLLLCFEVNSTDELNEMDRILEEENDPGTLVLDVTLPENIKEELFTQLAEKDYDLMFSGDPSEEEVLEQAKELQLQAANYGVVFSGIWYLTLEQYTNSNLEILQENGYTGFCQETNYAISLNSGATEEGLLYLEHVPVKTGDNKIESSLELCVDEHKNLAISFPLEEIMNLDQPEKLIESVMELIKKYASKDQMVLRTATEIVEQWEIDQQNEQEKEEAYNNYVKEQEQRIQELQKIVSDIYAEEQ